MPLIHLTAETLRLSIDPDRGASIVDFSIMGPAKFSYPLMRRASPGEINPSAMASFLMAPWANRIAGARFSFQGAQHALRATTADGHAQHGDVRHRAFTILDRSPSVARLELDSKSVTDAAGVNFPFPFLARIRYELSASALRVDVAIRNTGNRPMPAGCGHHPYFPRTLFHADDQLELRAPVTARYPLEKGIPVGPPQPDELSSRLAGFAPMPEKHTDAVFSGFGGTAELRWTRSRVALRMSSSPNMGHLVVFVPHADSASHSPLPYVAVEPQTTVNDGFNRAAAGDATSGMVTLGAGQSLECTTEFHVSTY